MNDAYDHPVGTVRINVTGTVNVFEASRRNGVGRTVLASTVWVYAGAHGDAPLDEDAPFHLPSAGHIYTSSKIASELIAHNYNELYDTPFTILRYGIPFGPRMREQLVIPRFVQMALDGDTITVHGDGSQFRNYVYVEDLADAHVLALSEDAENDVFNLEGAEPITIRRVTEAIRDCLDIPMKVEFGEARPGDYAGKEVSAEKVKRVLGWVPDDHVRGRDAQLPGLVPRRSRGRPGAGQRGLTAPSGTSCSSIPRIISSSLARRHASIMPVLIGSHP